MKWAIRFSYTLYTKRVNLKIYIHIRVYIFQRINCKIMFMIIYNTCLQILNFLNWICQNLPGKSEVGNKVRKKVTWNKRDGMCFNWNNKQNENENVWCSTIFIFDTKLFTRQKTKKFFLTTIKNEIKMWKKGESTLGVTAQSHKIHIHIFHEFFN